MRHARRALDGVGSRPGERSVRQQWLQAGSLIGLERSFRGRPAGFFGATSMEQLKTDIASIDVMYTRPSATMGDATIGSGPPCVPCSPRRASRAT